MPQLRKLTNKTIVSAVRVIFFIWQVFNEFKHCDIRKRLPLENNFFSKPGQGWSGGAKVLGKLPVLWRPTN